MNGKIFLVKVHCNGWRLAAYFEWSTITKLSPSPEEVDRVLWYISLTSSDQRTKETCSQEPTLVLEMELGVDLGWIRFLKDFGDFSNESAVGGDFHLTGEPSVYIVSTQGGFFFTSSHISTRSNQIREASK